MVRQRTSHESASRQAISAGIACSLAGGSVRLERRILNPKVEGSNPSQPIRVP